MTQKPDEPALLLRHTYTPADQEAFAELSGDRNPMHMDPLYARRTMMGAPVVHGVHMVAAALDALFKKTGIGNNIAALKADFLKPVMVNDTVQFLLTQGEAGEYVIAACAEDEAVLEITVKIDSLPAADSNSPTLGKIAHGAALPLTYDELEGKKGSLTLGIDTALAQKLFPVLTEKIGTYRLAELLSLTRLVGMHCPGLYSIFNRIDIRGDGKGTKDVLTYSVEKCDARFSSVLINVEARHLSGRVRAFFRPPPLEQPSAAAIRATVKNDRFPNSVALIIGGTRGLGEVTAKIIAAGGGLPIVTYHRGREDAERVAHDIKQSGGRCAILQLDVNDNEKAMRQVFMGEAKPASLYYFATPKIFGRRRKFFNYESLKEFEDYYVTGFGKLVDAALAQAGRPLRVFYPSSVAVEENIRDMAEYAMAKQSGEKLCAFYNRHASVEILVERLPRIHTDQTATLTGFPAASGFDVMLPIIERMERA